MHLLTFFFLEGEPVGVMVTRRLTVSTFSLFFFEFFSDSFSEFFFSFCVGRRGSW